MPNNGQRDETNDDSIGRRIKQRRKEQNLTLAEVAAAANLSTSHLSQIERDKTAPSLMTIASLAEALQVNVRDLFESSGLQVHVRRANHQEPMDAEPLSRQAEQLTIAHPAWQVQVVRLHLSAESPAVKSSGFAGEILGYILAGAMGVEIDAELYELTVGDSIHLDASLPHRIYGLNQQPCIALWCSSPPLRGAFNNNDH